MKYIPMSNAKLVDILVIAVAIPATLLCSHFFNSSPEMTVSLYYLVPIIYLVLRSHVDIARIALASFVLGILYGMSWNIVLEIHNAYSIVYQNAFLNARVIGQTPLVEFWWAFLASFYVFLFYEHFFPRPRAGALSQRSKLLTRVGVAVFSLTWLMLVVFPNFPHIPYAFLLLGLLLVPPLYALRYYDATFRRSVFFVTLFFLFINAGIDMALLSLHAGGFYGEYVGWIRLPSGSIPLEEFVFWYVCSTPALLVVYEWAFGDVQ